MKGLKYAELASHTETQLKKQIGENRSRITALSFQKSVGQLDNTAQFKTLRRDIARMETSIQSRKPAAK